MPDFTKGMTNVKHPTPPPGPWKALMVTCDG